MEISLLRNMEAVPISIETDMLQPGGAWSLLERKNQFHNRYTHGTKFLSNMKNSNKK
jgi:hypothetical protein